MGCSSRPAVAGVDLQQGISQGQDPGSALEYTRPDPLPQPVWEGTGSILELALLGWDIPALGLNGGSSTASQAWGPFAHTFSISMT